MYGAITKRTYKGKTYTSIFLRQTYREIGKVKYRALANLSAFPEHVVELVRRACFPNEKEVFAEEEEFRVKI
ncbi:hypothetical protein [Alicyclobacillus shizuokensis]|uniref:hypothetical protein n=1 Tax=Alicyclobacillus shizuokensis TaxID=392014 RepID=UPI00082F9039|nr:hypothetical protein [Alicyclobacillus shizuokensis]MCL6626270.1 hypothetical protein [Alicyclobacillus shizuokensis]